MKTQTFRFAAAAVLAMAIGSVQAGGIEALQKFNADTDGISGSFSQSVQSRNKTATPKAASASCAPASSNGNIPAPTNKPS